VGAGPAAADPQDVAQQDVFERSDGGQTGASEPGGRPWLGVRFACSGAYLRVYRNAAGTEYLARCPRCGKSVRFAVGPGGTGQRFFEVWC
jgi:hypothetical protein